MIGILLIYFIGKYFYKLAEDHDKNKWLHAILGIVVYYAGTLIAGFILGFGYVVINETEIMTDTTEILLSILGIPFGLGACWLFYYILKKKWEDDVIRTDAETY